MPLAVVAHTHLQSLVVTRLLGLIRRGVIFEHRPSRLFAAGPAARVTPAMKRVPALCYLQTARKRRGCRRQTMSDKTGLSDVSMSLLAHKANCQPAALSDGGAPHI